MYINKPEKKVNKLKMSNLGNFTKVRIFKQLLIS